MVWYGNSPSGRGNNSIEACKEIPEGKILHVHQKEMCKTEEQMTEILVQWER